MTEPLAKLQIWGQTRAFVFIFLLSLFACAWADDLTVDPPLLWDAVCLPCRPPEPPPICDRADTVIVDLVNPVYEEGVLWTDAGGVLTAPGLRVQAQKIRYIRQLDGEPNILTVSCEGNVLIDYGERVLVGDSLYYDFLTQRGFLINGRTASPPWYVGGREMLLMEGGKVVVVDGYITTSEGECKDVSFRSPYICLTPDQILTALHINFRIYAVPVLWWPYLQLDLKNIERLPFGVRYGWGGYTGSYVSVLYRFLSLGDLKATARFDGYIGKGIGAGIETVYNPRWRPTEWYSRNYYATDIPLDTPQRRNRYRFQGTFRDCVRGVSIDGMYDVLSDAHMATNYQTQDFDLNTAGNTQLNFGYRSPAWIGNLFTKVRVNSFQSVNQELPTFQMDLHPFSIPGWGIICQNSLKATYYNFVFSNEIINGRGNLSSSRIAVHPFFYRPFLFGPFTFTPEAGFIGIAYSNSPGGKSAGQAAGEFGVRFDTSLSRGWQSWKHVAEPYVHYNYLTAPRVPTNNHFIFSINDGIDRLDILRFGVRNSFFHKNLCGVTRPLWIDLWANAFFDTPTIHQTIPRGYLDIEWIPTPRLLCALDTGWDFQEKRLDFFNVRTEWTWSLDLAFALEYRHRSEFYWRKADFYNFLLESVRTQQELLASDLSDRRDTLLFRLFTRPTPDWTAIFNLRYGWNRKNQPHYLEYDIEMARVIFQHWRLAFTYEKRESDNRYSVSLLLNPGPPNRSKWCR